MTRNKTLIVTPIESVTRYKTLIVTPIQSAQTSCGLTLKVLRKTPMYTCGNHLVMVIPTSSNSRSGQPSALFVPALSVAGPAKGRVSRWVI